MINLKEECKLVYKRLAKIYYINIAIILLLALLPKSITEWKTIFGAIEILLVGISIIFLISTMTLIGYPFYNLIMMIKETHKDAIKIELVDYYSLWYTKIFVNVLVSLSGIMLGSLEESILTKFSTEQSSYFSFNLSVSFAGAMIEYAIFYPVLMAFIYLLVSQQHGSNNRITTFVSFVFIYGMIKGMHMEVVLLYIVELLSTVLMIWKSKRIYKSRIVKNLKNS